MALATTTAEADARLASKDKDVNVPGFTLTRMWPFIDATAADTLGTTLDAVATYSGPKADNQTYSGTFVNSKVYLDEAGSGRISVQENNERYVNIIQTLIKVTTVTAYTDLATPLVIQDNVIPDIFAYEDGETDTMTYEYRNLNPSDASRKACMGISEANLIGLANVATVTPASGWEYLDRRFDESPDGTGVFRVIFKQTEWTNETGTTPNQTILRARISGYSNTDPQNAKYGIKATKTTSSPGIPIADLEEIRDNQVAESGYAITGISARDNKDGSGTIGTSQTKKRAKTDYVLAKYTAQVGNQQASITDIWHDLSKTDANLIKEDAWAQYADLSGSAYGSQASMSGYKLGHCTINPTSGVDSSGDDLFDVVRLGFVPIWKYSVFGTRHNTATEVEWKYDEITVHDSTGALVKKTRTVWRLVFSTYAGALAYAVSGTGGTPAASDSYYDSQGVQKTQAKVEYVGQSAAGADQWAGYNVQLA